jgi:signal transduction histidine kinase
VTESQLSEDRLRSLVEVGRGLVAERDLDVLLDRVLEVACQLTEAKYGAIGVLDDRSRELEQFITRGLDKEAHQAIGALPRGRGVLGLLIDDPKPLRLADVGEHPRSYGFPAGHPPMKTFLGVPITVRGEAWGNLYLTDKANGEFTDADEEAAGILAAWAAIAIDNARLYRSLESRRDELERAVRGLEATTAIARAVGGETELERVLELIVKRARALVEARALVIALEEGGELVVAATAGEISAETLGMRIALDGTIAGEVFRTGRPVRLSMDIGSRLRASLRDALEASTELAVPLQFRGRAWGVLAAFDRLGPDPEFDAEDERLMLSFAASAATAVATAKGVAEDRLRHSIRSTEAERGRWARELHDQTLQSLAAVRVLLSAALRQGKPEALEAAARDASDQIGEEITSLRALITELRPAALDELGLEPAIESLLERFRATQGVAVSHSIVLHERLPAELESTVYRLIQEALTNVAKHADADSAEVHLAVEGHAVEIVVSDDGVGMDVEAATDGFGLVGMRERVSLVGGALEIESAPGSGTTIRAQVPVPTEGATGADVPRIAGAG